MRGSYISKAHLAVSYYVYLLDLSLVTPQLGCNKTGVVFVVSKMMPHTLMEPDIQLTLSQLEAV